MRAAASSRRAIRWRSCKSGRFDRQKENSGDDVDEEFDAEKRWRGVEIDVVICAELFDSVNNKFLNQIGAVGNAGDEGAAGNRNLRGAFRRKGNPRHLAYRHRFAASRFAI